jgi:hypothetical protein
MKKAIIIVSILLGYLLTLSAQGIKIGGNSASVDSSAILDVNSSLKGVLLPRMTENQKNAISNPAEALVVFQIDVDPGFYYWNGTAWRKL